MGKYNWKKMLLMSALLLCIIMLSSFMEPAYAESEQWEFIDGNNANGLNSDASLDATEAKVATVNGDVYVAWQESNGTATQIRVKKRDKINGSWSYIDGGGASGLNYNPLKAAANPELAVYNDELYIVWQEFDDSAGADLIHARKYSGTGSSWTDIDDRVNDKFIPPEKYDPCVNYGCTAWATDPVLEVYNGNLYAAWVERNNKSYQMRVSRYDGGQVWNQIDGNLSDGLNYNTDYDAYFPKIMAHDGYLFATWGEFDGSITQLRVKKYKDGVWTSADGNAMQNYDVTTASTPEAEKSQETFQSSALMSVNGGLYLGWEQSSYELNRGQMRLKKYNGDSWTWADGNTAYGLNYNYENAGTGPQMAGNSNYLFISWTERYRAGTSPRPDFVRVLKYEGDSSAFIDGNVTTAGINYNNLNRGEKVALSCDGQFLYAVWQENAAWDSTNPIKSRIHVKRMALPYTTTAASVSPEEPTVGTAKSIKLTVLNGLGNIDQSFNGEKMVTVSGYTAAPDGSYGSFNGTVLGAAPQTIAVSFTDGVATSNLVLNKAAAQNITFSIARVNTPQTNTITITPVPSLAVSMTLNRDITAPATNGGQFAQQPQIILKDAYGNICSNNNTTEISVAKSDGGDWSLDGTFTKAVSSGVVSFDNLGVSNVLAVTGAKLEFASGALSKIYSSAVNLPGSKVAAPTANTVAGTVAAGTSVTLSSTTGESKIYYTTNGDTPTAGSIEYTSPVIINSSVTLKAIAVKASMLDSEILSNEYIVSANSVPVRKSGVAATAVASRTVNTAYTLNLGTIFEDANGDTMNYKVSVNGASDIAANVDYSYTPATAGSNTLTFKANDGSADSTETYTVTLTATNQPNNHKSTSVGEKSKPENPNTVDLKTPFADVKEGDWFYGKVALVRKLGLMQGTSDKNFEPNIPTKRGMIITALYNMAGKPKEEASGTQLYASSREWALKNGISDGKNMDGEIAREQIVTMLWRNAGSPMVNDNKRLSKFKDAGTISDYAKQAFSWANQQGIILGKGNGVLDPKGEATRAEASTMIINYLNAMKK